MKNKWLLGAMAGIFLMISWGVPPAQGVIKIGDLEISGFLRNETALRVKSPGDLMKMRTEFNLEFNYQVNSNIRAFLMLRPFYDGVFDLESEGMGNRHSEFEWQGFTITNDKVKHKYDHNLDQGDTWDPLLREAWIEVLAGPIEAKVGRQIVVWGRSDGLRLLDIVNPFNEREYILPADEDSKIPLWMINLTYWVDWYRNGLQFLFMPFYRMNHSPPGGHNWAVNPMKTLRMYEQIYGYETWGGIKWNEPSHSLSNSDIGLRWYGTLGDSLTYTLNYLHCWDRYPTMWATGPWVAPGINLEYTLEPDRISIFGFSFDYGVEKALGMENWVLRGEFAYYKKDRYGIHNYQGTSGQPSREKDHINYLIGIDKYVFIDHWLSVQFLQDIILHPPKGEVTSGASAQVVDGVENYFTFYWMKDWAQFADKLHTECMVVYTDDGGGWVNPEVKWEFTKIDGLFLTVGAHFFWGSEMELLGQMDDNDHVFMTWKWGF